METQNQVLPFAFRGGCVPSSAAVAGLGSFWESSEGKLGFGFGLQGRALAELAGV